MPSQNRDFFTLLEQVRAGNQQAARQLEADYSPGLFRVARHLLNRGLRSKYDPADFVQCVWKDFFDGTVHRHSFDGPHHLARFLGRMAQHQICMEQSRFLDTAQRDVHRETLLTEAHEATLAEASSFRGSAEAEDQEERALRVRQMPASIREVVDGFDDGLALRAIAALLRLSERAIRLRVQRWLKKLKPAR